MKKILPWLLVAILTGSLFFVFHNTEQKDREIALLQKQTAELQAMRAEVEELKQSAVNNKELARLRKENAEVLQLRNQVFQLKKEHASFAAQKSHAEELQIESQLTPERIAQLVKENQQLHSEAQEFEVLRDVTAGNNNCINNLRMLDGATEQWALENRKRTGDLVNTNDIAPYLKKFPVCVAGGVYSVGPVGTPPTCNIPGHALPQ